MVYLLISWVVELGVCGSSQGLATAISAIGHLVVPSSDVIEIM